MNWNPWKVTAIAMALMMATALVAGLVVANRVGTERYETKVVAATPTASVPAPRVARTPLVPTQAVVEACNRYASAHADNRDKTADTVKNVAVGAVLGAADGGKGGAIGGILGAGGGTLYGLNETKKHDERYREAYGSCMRARGYSG
ncbi:MAG: hypothetical protein E6J75_04005 [Deltaproteobacteria bacterium]|nr:MAG: hypothetical protein E6J75_04005 [Deltaproteobacteria bacterium]